MFIVYDTGQEKISAMLLWSAAVNFISDGKEWKLKALKKKPKYFLFAFEVVLECRQKETPWIPDIAQEFAGVKRGESQICLLGNC